MVNAYCNELSLCGDKVDDSALDAIVGTFAQTLRTLHENKVKRVHYDTLDHPGGLSLHTALSERQRQMPTEVNLIYSMLRRPYAEEPEEEKFCNYDDHKWVTREGGRVDCIGLALCALMQSLCVSLDYGRFAAGAYTQCEVELVKDGVTHKVDVPNMSQPEQINKEAIIEFFVRSLTDADVPTAKKKEPLPTLPAHHGKGELQAFAKRIIEDDYVQAVLVSLPFDPQEKTFIHAVKHDHIIEVRLVQSRLGYGLRLSTSAQTDIQNQWIARHLNKKFGSGR